MTTLNQGLTEVVAGSVARAYMQWTLNPPVADLGSAYVSWQLIDSDGRVYMDGEGEAVDVRAHGSRPGYYNLKCFANISIPANLPVNNSGSKYQICWIIKVGSITSPSFDNFTVLPPEYQRLGSQDSVDLFGEQTEVNISLPQKAKELRLNVFRGNNQVLSRLILDEPQQTPSGYLYTVKLVPSMMDGNQASLVPLTLTWRYKLEEDGLPLVENSNLYLVNPTMLTAMNDVQAFVNRALISDGIDPGTNFTQLDMVRHLRRGMDTFNMMVRPTNFIMTNAQGGVRQFWLLYSSVDACRAQYLAEGMKAFQYTSQATGLDVDRTQYWQTMADNLQSEADSQIKIFKDNLGKWGQVGGDGNVLGPRPGSVGSIGIALSPITPLRQSYLRFFGVGQQG